ncbi:MAG: sugar ABC transporter substrate-binding protein [Desulfobacterales bacterium]|nr:sugar ABC transporter substrate-binding protein [Desulfobacterales bacterium]
MKRALGLSYTTGIIMVLALTCLADDKPFAGMEISVLAQQMPTWEVIDQKLPLFEAETGMKVRIEYLKENERRSESRTDASTGIGKYDVYYVDEANIAEFVKPGWVFPILVYYPKKYDFPDFLKWMVAVASVDGIPYYAPIWGGGDFMFYRKDMLEQSGVAVPKNLDELMKAVKKMHNPPKVYGMTTRGLSGSGANVWRWQDYFAAFGGKWFDEKGNPSFNSPAAVKATEYYLEMLKYSPPDSATSTFVDNIKTFRTGKAVFFIDGDVFYSLVEDPEKSLVAGKIGYAVPPSPLPSGAYVHGLAISAVGAKTKDEKKAAAEFIAWATSKEMEIARVEKGIVSEYARKSTLNSSQMEKYYPSEVRATLAARGKITKITFMRRPEWPDIGDYLGGVLEKLFTGDRTDIQKALDDAVKHAKKVLGKKSD